jgi:hypothetical protein
VVRSLSIGIAVVLVASSLRAQTLDTSAVDLSVVNRERTLRFTLLLDGDALAYRVDRLTAIGAPNVVLEPSPLGITRASEDFTHGLTLASASRASDVVDWYKMTTGKQREIRSRARQRTFTFRAASGSMVTISVRVYADGVAFRYGFPSGASEQDSVVAEATGFHLPSLDGRAWMQPYARVSASASAYEGDYRNGIEIGTAAPENAGWALPMLFHSNGSWILVSEAGLDRTSYGVHIEQNAAAGVYRVRLPEAAETVETSPRAATISFPWVSPWRVIMIGPTLASIVESTLVTDLAAPATFSDVSWIKAGRVSWSWWSDTASTRDYQKVFPFVDLAQRMHWEYSLLGAGWQEMQNGGDATELAEYARTRGVGLLVWYDPTRRHGESADSSLGSSIGEPDSRISEFHRIRELGFKGISVDFLRGEKQSVIAQYEDILRDAAANHLVVDFHGSSIPRGWQRTYPNLLSMDAVKGAVHYDDSLFTLNAATLNTIYPFTRNAIGSMDYAPLVLGDAPGRFTHLTTNAHELALSVMFESGLQHFVSTPAMIDSQPDYVRRFLQVVPAAWDESRFVDGFPGQFAVLARRRGTDWYVGAINGDTVVSIGEVPLTFLGVGPYDVQLISDGEDDRSFTFATQRLDARDTMTVEMAPRGGFVARIVPRRAPRPAPVRAPGAPPITVPTRPRARSPRAP